MAKKQTGKDESKPQTGNPKPLHISRAMATHWNMTGWPSEAARRKMAEQQNDQS